MNDTPDMKAQQNSWSILSMQKTLPYLGEVGGLLGAHNYIALADPKGEIVQEMHGVPSREFTLSTSPGNYLQVIDLKPGRYMNDQAVMSKKLVLSGTEQEMRGKYDEAFNVVSQSLDRNHTLYAGAVIIGHAVNSNSVWNTALLTMGVDKTSHYDGPLSTPGRSVDLRIEPTNNDLVGKPAEQAMWKPNPRRMDEPALPSFAIAPAAPPITPAPQTSAVTIPAATPSPAQQMHSPVRMGF